MGCFEEDCMHVRYKSSLESFGYHLSEIDKGELGEFSKIEEEFLELKDAIQQDVAILQLCELSDLLGAIHFWLERHHPSIGIADLIAMGELTKRAFESGKRK